MKKYITALIVVSLITLISASSVEIVNEGVDTKRIINLDLITILVESFLDLTDTPSTYSGSAGLCVVVNSSENALEFVACNSTAGSINGSDFVRRDGTLALTADWNAGNFTILATEFNATIINGTTIDAGNIRLSGNIISSTGEILINASGDASGGVLITTDSDANIAFQVRKADGGSVMSIDTVNNRINVVDIIQVSAVVGGPSILRFGAETSRALVRAVSVNMTFQVDGIENNFFWQEFANPLMNLTGGGNLWISRNLTVENSLFVNANNSLILSRFGPEPTTLNIQDRRDTLAVVRIKDGVGANSVRNFIALTELNLTGSTPETISNFALNAFVETTVESDANMTRPDACGTSCAGRYAFKHRGSGNVTLAGGVGAYTEITGSFGNGTIDHAYSFQAEPIDGGTAGGVIGRGDGLWIRDSVGNVNTTYGIYIDSLTNADRAYAIFMEAANRALSSVPVLSMCNSSTGFETPIPTFPPSWKVILIVPSS